MSKKLSSEASYWKEKYMDQMECIDPDNETDWRDEIHTILAKNGRNYNACA